MTIAAGATKGWMKGRSPLAFFLLVFALAIPFLLIGAVTRIQLLPGLPVASLMAVCPATAALILVYRDDGAAGAKALLKEGLRLPADQGEGLVRTHPVSDAGES